MAPTPAGFVEHSITLAISITRSQFVGSRCEAHTNTARITSDGTGKRCRYAKGVSVLRAISLEDKEEGRRYGREGVRVTFVPLSVNIEFFFVF